MLSADQNDLLSKVGPGSPMGELLRRYWHPIAAVGELDDDPVKPVRLMGEDLVLFKDANGAYGLLERHCPHRRADLAYGWVEKDGGLRCSYHGWHFDAEGRCVAQPFEQTAHPDGAFRDKTPARAYKAQAKAGLVWAYMGPAPVPELWDWDRYHDRGYKQIVFSDVPCNWLQCQENSIDPVHFEWLHFNWSFRLKGRADYAPTHLRIGFDEFEWGYRYLRVRADTDEENELWTVGRVCLWPNALYVGHFEWRVPVDDENTLSVGWFLDPLPGSRPFEQERIPHWRSPITDDATGKWVTSHVMNQDFTAWTGQGAVSDRWNEHLGESDRGVIILRKRFMDDLATVADGGDPKGVLRDPARNSKIPLPRTRGEAGNTVAPDSGPVPFVFLSGQPAAVREELQAAWDEHADDEAPPTHASSKFVFPLPDDAD